MDDETQRRLATALARLFHSTLAVGGGEGAVLTTGDIASEGCTDASKRGKEA